MPNWGGGAGGAMSGAMTGAGLGSIVPGIGTGIGAGIGGIIGGIKGLFGGKKKKSATGPTGQGYEGIMGQWQNQANTGGLTPQNLADIRTRTVSPIRSIYSGARRGVDQQRRLQGGYSPNYSASLAKMAREQSMSTSEASTGAEANIAEMQQKGKLAGLQGMSQLWGTHQNAPTDMQRGLTTAGMGMDLIGRGATAAGSIADAFKVKKSGAGSGMYSGPSNIYSQNASSGLLPSRRL